MMTNDVVSKLLGDHHLALQQTAIWGSKKKNPQRQSVVSFHRILALVPLLRFPVH